MEKRRLIQNLTIIVLGVAIIVMAVGYANYDATLEINGDATATAAKWDIHFANPVNVSVPASSTTKQTPSNKAYTNQALIDSTTKKVTFDCSLEPGETYSFNVDIVNGGTFDARLTSITGIYNTQLRDSTNTNWLTASADQALTYGAGGVLYSNDYLTYKVAYDDGTALVAGSPSGDTITAGQTKKLLVSVSYAMPTDASKLPSVDTNYHFELDLKYDQI